MGKDTLSKILKVSAIFFFLSFGIAILIFTYFTSWYLSNPMRLAFFGIKGINFKYYPNNSTILLKGYHLLGPSFGISMLPAIPCDSLLIVSYNFSEEDLKPGVIVGYYDDKDVLVVHRIVSRYGNKIVVKGDNNPLSDMEIINANDVKFIVVGVLYTEGEGVYPYKE